MKANLLENYSIFAQNLELMLLPYNVLYIDKIEFVLIINAQLAIEDATLYV